MSTATVYETSPTKRKRRTKAEIADLKGKIYLELRADNPMTVRQLFYRLVSLGVIDKTEAEYKNTVCRLTAIMRRAGDLPFEWLADNTRWMRKPRTHHSLAQAFRDTVRTYRRSVWDNQDAYVEVWLEKDALAGVLYEVTEKWDVPLMVSRGFSSLSFLHSAGEAIAEVGKPTYLYYFGDHDPSGVDIPRKIEQEIRTFAPKVDVHFERVAVLPEQIEEMGLPTRPTKKSDSRSKNFKGDSVEVDAIPSRTIREMVADCISRHVDRAEHERMLNVERMELETLERICTQINLPESFFFDPGDLR